MKKRLFIFGAGQIAEIAFQYLTESGKSVSAFLADEGFAGGGHLFGLPILHPDAANIDPETDEIFVAVSYANLNSNREKICRRFLDSGFQLPNCLSPDAIYKSPISPNTNCFIFEANVIQPFVNIGSFVTLWSGNHIGHHSTIGNSVFISSHVVVSGNCEIGDRTFVGVNATLHDGVRVGSDCIIAAGAVVDRDLPSGSVIVPAAKGRVLDRDSSSISL